MRPKIYVASPLGFSEAGRFFYSERFLKMIQEVGFGILDPWNSPRQALIQEAMEVPYGLAKRNRWAELNPLIGSDNEQAIRKANLVCAVLDGTDVDSGTASEIGFATALGIPCIGYRGDFRLSADNEGLAVNLQVEYWIGKHDGQIVTNLHDLELVLMAWYGRLVTPE